jgi:hypothetical protein
VSSGRSQDLRHAVIDELAPAPKSGLPDYPEGIAICADLRIRPTVLLSYTTTTAAPSATWWVAVGVSPDVQSKPYVALTTPTLLSG